MPKPMTVLLIVLVLVLLLGFVPLWNKPVRNGGYIKVNSWNKAFSIVGIGKMENVEPPQAYQTVTLADIETNKGRLSGKRVEYVGIWEAMFETSNLDGKIWLTSSPETAYVPDKKVMPGVSSGYYHAKVKVQGTLQAEKGQWYGHMGFSPYQIVADRIELLEKLEP